MKKISRRKFLQSLFASGTILSSLPLLLSLQKHEEKLDPKEASYYKRLAG